jgi:hypothetical protein
MPTEHSISPDIRAAIAAFLNECQTEARPFATKEAMGAIRMIFPDLDVSDSELEGAISSEAAAAGFDIEAGPATRKGQSATKRRVADDMDGTQRPIIATRDRNQLI